MAVVTWEGLLEGEELAYLTEVAGQDPRTVALPELHPKLEAALRARGVESLFAHQAESLAAARRGSTSSWRRGPRAGRRWRSTSPSSTRSRPSRSCARSTSTRRRRLAQDQARSLAELAVPRVKPAIYDGDTEHERRWQIRKWANAILTNPDMLHVGVLPHHDRWADVLSNLRYVVVDEAHVYRGVFGSHVGNVLRRLRRAARIYGADPQFLLASATIANPGELARSLLGVDVTVVDADAAPRAARTIAFWNPPVLDEALQLRASALGEGARLLAELVSRGLRTICFAKSRKAVELIHRFASERLDAETAARLSPYRAGYTPAQRREVERRLVEGSCSASRPPTRSSSASTSASSTAPSRSGSRERSPACASSGDAPGGAATGLRCSWPARTRSTSSSCASPRRCSAGRSRPPSSTTPTRILDGHVLSAAFEAPLDERDRETLGDAALERAEALVVGGELRKDAGGHRLGRA